MVLSLYHLIFFLVQMMQLTAAVWLVDRLVSSFNVDINLCFKPLFKFRLFKCMLSSTLIEFLIRKH